MTSRHIRWRKTNFLSMAKLARAEDIKEFVVMTFDASQNAEEENASSDQNFCKFSRLHRRHSMTLEGGARTCRSFVYSIYILI